MVQLFVSVHPFREDDSVFCHGLPEFFPTWKKLWEFNQSEDRCKWKKTILWKCLELQTTILTRNDRMSFGGNIIYRPRKLTWLAGKTKHWMQICFSYSRMGIFQYHISFRGFFNPKLDLSSFRFFQIFYNKNLIKFRSQKPTESAVPENSSSQPPWRPHEDHLPGDMSCDICVTSASTASQTLFDKPPWLIRASETSAPPKRESFK